MLGQLFAGGIAGVLSGAKSLIEEFHIDPAKKIRLQLELMKAEHQIDRAQITVNVHEAKHPNWFVSGWRPGVGWTCVAGLAYQAVLQPMMNWGLLVSGSSLVPPEIDTSLLTTVLLGLLGLGGIRAFEKMKGVARG